MGAEIVRWSDVPVFNGIRLELDSSPLTPWAAGVWKAYPKQCSLLGPRTLRLPTRDGVLLVCASDVETAEGLLVSERMADPMYSAARTAGGAILIAAVTVGIAALGTARYHEIDKTIDEVAKEPVWLGRETFVSTDDAMRIAEALGEVEAVRTLLIRTLAWAGVPAIIIAFMLVDAPRSGALPSPIETEPPPVEPVPGPESGAGVYFVQGASGGPIKIGKSTTSVAERVKSLQTAHHDELRILAVHASAEDEGRIHERFDHLRIRGEWFRPEPDLLEFVAAVVAGAEIGGA